MEAIVGYLVVGVELGGLTAGLMLRKPGRFAGRTGSRRL
jgi:hypothetical protein